MRFLCYSQHEIVLEAQAVIIYIVDLSGYHLLFIEQNVKGDLFTAL